MSEMTHYDFLISASPKSHDGEFVTVAQAEQNTMANCIPGHCNGHCSG